MADFTQQLIAVATENPPGNHYARCAEVIERKLIEMGLVAGAVGPGPCVLASYGDGDRWLHFHGHYDVVPASVDGQFEPYVKGANLFGRGSSDMKSGLVAMIYAVHALRVAKVLLNVRIQLVIVPDEETGGQRGSAWLREAGRLGATGSVGMLTAEPTSGVVWNGNRGAISLRVTAKGKAAHVGLSHQGVNAFEKMLAVAGELQKLKEEVHARGSILLIGGECRGGSNFNVVPDRCSFTVDRRTNPDEDFATEKRRLLDIVKEHDVEIIQEGSASWVSEDHSLARTLAAAIESVTTKQPRFEMCPGLLENRFYAERGIPAFAYGPGLLSVSHGPNEFVPLRNIRDCAAVYALTALSV